MDAFLNAVGFFIYPLGLCSVSALAVIIERLVALRRSKVIPPYLASVFFAGGDVSQLDAEVAKRSLVGRLLIFQQSNLPQLSELRAFASLEISRLQRGFFVLDTVVAAAPLLGLLGTVWGLYAVFSGFSPEDGMPNPTVFVESLGLALTTTMLGLLVALPALVGNIYLQRRVDAYAAEIELGIERIAAQSIAQEVE